MDKTLLEKDKSKQNITSSNLLIVKFLPMLVLFYLWVLVLLRIFEKTVEKDAFALLDVIFFYIL